MAHRGVVLLDVDVRIRFRTAPLIEDERIAAHAGGDTGRARRHANRAAVGCDTAVLTDRLANDTAGGVRCKVHRLRASVLMLTLRGNGNRDDFGVRLLAKQVNAWILHGDLRPSVRVDPLNGGTGMRVRTLRHQVVDIVRPVLDRGVAHLCTWECNHLDDGDVQRVGCPVWRGAPLDVVEACALIDNDQRALKLPRVLAVDAEVGL